MLESLQRPGAEGHPVRVARRLGAHPPISSVCPLDKRGHHDVHSHSVDKEAVRQEEAMPDKEVVPGGGAVSGHL